MTILRTLLSLVVLLSAAAPVAAIGPAPFPDTTLTTLDATRTSTAALPADGKWLVIYVRPDCASCAAVLQAANASRHPELLRRLVVIVAAGATDAAATLAEQRPELKGASWFVDADASFAKALKLHEAPVILGVSGRTIQWSLAGVLSGGSKTESVMASWVE